jgi:hypothetical protein
MTTRHLVAPGTVGSDGAGKKPAWKPRDPFAEKKSKFWPVTAAVTAVAIAGFAAATHKGNKERDAGFVQLCSDQGGLEFIGRVGLKPRYATTLFQTTPRVVEIEAWTGEPMKYLSDAKTVDDFRTGIITFTPTPSGLVPDRFEVDLARSRFAIANPLDLHGMDPGGVCMGNIDSKLKVAYEVASLRASLGHRHQDR